MNLKFNANVICAAEAVLDKRFVDILAELESKEGASLSTLRALLAAGISGARYPSGFLTHLDTSAAGAMLDERGIAAVAKEVGKGLKAYFEGAA